MKSPSFWQTRGLFSTLLLPAGAVYSAVGAWRQSQASPVKMPVPVICIGNAVAGGAGKTPSVLALTQLLLEQNLRAVALSRGYGGEAAGPLLVQPGRHSSVEVGDEALLLAKHLPTVISRYRPAGAELAIAEGAQVIVMDDGFQNPSLHKDRHLLVIDGSQGFGNGRVMPAGSLREPATRAMARADAILVIGDIMARKLPLQLKGFKGPVFHAQMEHRNGEEFRRTRCVAFAGIARPDKFFKSLSACGATLVKTAGFADHHVFRAGEITALVKTAERLGAMLVTTRKDYMRLTPQQQAQVKVLDVELVFAHDEKERLLGWLREAVHV